MSAAPDVTARVASCRAKAENLVGELRALIGELPEWREEAEGRESALMGLRAELEEALDWIEPAIDYLTPRSDDNAPECCAHRRLLAAGG